MLNVRPVRLPADLANASNGRLASTQLVSVGFPARSGGQLHLQAARAWWALAAACLAATGVILTVTSVADAYRSYDRQFQTFMARYEPVSYARWLLTSRQRRRTFQGRYWALRAGNSPSATPGTSNHGWGVAFDVCEITANGSILGIASSRAWGWLQVNADQFGLSWEYTRPGIEDWHLHLYVGDATTQATVAHEQGLMSELPPFDPARALFGLWPLATNKPRIGPFSAGDAVLYAQGVMFHRSANGNIQVHGHYDTVTIDRVRELQAWFGLPVDGWVGPQTWSVIDALAGRQ